MNKHLFALTGLAMASLAASATAATFSESFNGVAAGTALTSGGWFTDGSPLPTVTAGAGVAGSQGLTNGQNGFNWTAHPFNWSSLAVGDKVTLGIDLQTSSSGQFNDDRLGWTTAAAGTATSSTNHFGTQLDNVENGGFVTYWKINGTTVYRKIIDFSSVTFKNDTWYRAGATYTKLTNSSCSIAVSVQELDALGALTGTALTGSLPDTAALSAAEAPPATYFPATDIYPMYKNFSSTGGNADNVSFGVVAVPEPASLAFVILGACALGARRRAH